MKFLIPLIPAFAGFGPLMIVIGMQPTGGIWFASLAGRS